MTKILIQNLKGHQEVINVGSGGGYFDSSKILWDERIHGPFTQGEQVGGLAVRDLDGVRSLTFDSALKAIQDASVQAGIDEIAQKETQKNLLKQKLKALDEQPDLTATEMKECLRKLVKFLLLKKYLD